MTETAEAEGHPPSMDGEEYEPVIATPRCIEDATTMLRGGIKQILDAVQMVIEEGHAADLPAPMQKLARRLAEADAEFVEDMTGSYETYGDVIDGLDEDEDLGDLPIDWGKAEADAQEEARKEEEEKAKAEAAAAIATAAGAAAADHDPLDPDEEADGESAESEKEREEREKFDAIFSERAFD